MNKKYILWALAVVILMVILIAVGKNRGGNNTEVYVGKPELRTISASVTANGKIRPEAEVKISPDVSGEIIELNVEEGDTVHQGQLLLKINPDLYVTARDRASAGLSSAQSSFKTAQAALLQAEARFMEQQAQFKRNKKLHEESVISDAEFETMQTAYLVAESEVKASKERVMAAQFGIDNAQAGLNEATKNLGRTSIYSPTDGIVSALNNEQGERVVGTAQMAGTEIMTIANFNNMEVIVDVNENDILEIMRNDSVDIEVDAYNDRKFKGIVTEIASSANNVGLVTASADQVTNFEVKIRIMKSSYEDLLERTETPFLPGMSASVEIMTERKDSILCLPIEAVGTRMRPDSIAKSDDELDEVIFILEDGKAAKRIVKTGIQDTRYIEIVSGLEPEEEVIIGPYDAVSKKLRDGKAVEVTEKKVMTRNGEDE